MVNTKFHRLLCRDGERGSALILIVVFLTILSLLPIVNELSKISNQDAYMHERTGVEALNVARAGMMDSIAWFQRQVEQPVCQRSYLYPDAAFDPVYIAGNPSKSDTIDASTGIVNVYAIDSTKNIWARYEVKKQKGTGLASEYDPTCVHDISHRVFDNGVAGEGRAWYIESAGYIYKLISSTKPFNSAPNILIGKARMSTEIVALEIKTSTKAALTVNRLDGIHLSGAVLSAEKDKKSAIAHSAGTGDMSPLENDSKLLGISTGTFDGSISAQEFFGISPVLLNQLSDVSVSTISELPPALPANGIVFLRKPATFYNLNGSGLLYVNGDLCLRNTKPNYFNGVIFVDGNLFINIPVPSSNIPPTAPLSIHGAVIVTGSVHINGETSTHEIIYDENQLSNLRAQLANYRQNKSAFRVLSNAADTN